MAAAETRPMQPAAPASPAEPRTSARLPGPGAPAHAGLRSARAAVPGERLVHGLGSWPFVVASAVAVAVVAAAVLVAAGPTVAVLQLALIGLVLVELPLLFMAVRAADRASSGIAIDHLDADRQLAGEVDELADTVARLAVELARLNARLRSGSAAGRQEGR
jgi:hypothetical protein